MVEKDIQFGAFNTTEHQFQTQAFRKQYQIKTASKLIIINIYVLAVVHILLMLL